MNEQRISTLSKQDYATPHWLFNMLNANYGFTIDCCATRENAKLPRFWTEEVDGLRQNWGPERVFCNPPFNDMQSWIEKAIFETSQSYCPLVCMLCNNDCSTDWWHLAYSHSTHRIFINRRIKYIGAPQAQMISSMCFLFTPHGFAERTAFLRITPEKMRELDIPGDFYFPGLSS